MNADLMDRPFAPIDEAAIEKEINERAQNPTQSKKVRKEKEKEVSPQLLFAQFIAKKNEYGTRDGTIYKWSETHWQAMPDEEMERAAHHWLVANAPNKCNERTSASCVATLILHLPPLPNVREGVIPLLSGSVMVDDLGIHNRESNREDGLTYVIECEFKPNANRDMFDGFLFEALPNKEIRDFLQEYAGYTLLPDTRHELAAWLIGAGGTGKSTFAHVMQAMHRQTVAMSLDALDGFNLAGLQSASLVCVDETPPRIDEQKLKTLVSGGVIQVDRKYRDALTLRPSAKWIVNGNALPAISDHSTGFWRRWVIFPFNVVPAQKAPLLAESIIDRELSGVLNWCLDGLVRLLARGNFPELPSEMDAAASGGKQQSNNVSAWVVDCGICTSDDWVSRKEVYQTYSIWCGESGTKSVSSQKFFERLKVALPGLEEKRVQFGGERNFKLNLHLPPHL